jgi:methyl acetate hydrolase
MIGTTDKDAHRSGTHKMRNVMANLAPISELLKRATEAGDVPGVAAGVATSDGVIFEAAHGQRDLAGTPMTKDAIFRIASMTKAVTGACAMQMVEQGKLDLDSPIARVLPELAEPKVLEGYEAGKPKLRPAKRPITLRHLLTHTSGHVYETWNPKLAEYRQVSGTPSNGSGLLVSLNSPLLFDPGERWEYSIGIDWAGRAVEEASGLKLADYMTRNLLAPLGMLDTSFRINDHQKQRLVQLYMRGNDGLKPFERNPPPNAEFDAGGGGLYSTIPDYLKFTQMILNRGKLGGVQVLKPETIVLMSQNAMGDVDVVKLPASPQLPTGGGMSNEVNFIDGKKWGLTFMVNPKPMPSGRSPGSMAWAGLMNSYYWIDPVRKISGVYATQILPFCDVKSLKLFEDFETAVYKAL